MRTKEQINAASVKRMRAWRAKQCAEEIARHEPVVHGVGSGRPAFPREGGTTIRDLESWLGRSLYAWEHDLWLIAGWCGSRRFLKL